MTSTPLHIVQLNDEIDVSVLTQKVRESCRSNLFDMIDTEEFVLACSEIGHNAVRHGQGGHAKIHEFKNGKHIKVDIEDSGPGIPNIDLAKREGYSTVKTSLGLGLEGAQRLVDNFNIESSTTSGTTVTLEKYRPLTKETVDYGLVSIPDNNYNYNGDQYILKEYDGDSLIIGVVDGPGQGYDAHSIAQTCKQFVEGNFQKPLSELLLALNTLMKESNDDVGITCSLSRISPSEFQYAGIGDTHAYVRFDKGDILHLSNQEGRIGQLKKVKNQIFHHEFKNSVDVILCSDGIKTIYNPSMEIENTQELANMLFDTYHRPSGDATIIIANYKI